MNTHSCRLVLSLPDSAAAPDLLEPLLDGGDIAALLLPGDMPGFSGADCSRLPAVQQRGIACLLKAPAPTPLPQGYDGIMFGKDVTLAELRGARAELGSAVMIGAECDLSRDHAMVKGEAGLDVLAFAHDGSPEKLGHLCELVAWWSELFVLPSLVTGDIGLGDAAALIEAGADFLAPMAPLWNAPAGPQAALRAYQNLAAGGQPS